MSDENGSCFVVATPNHPNYKSLNYDEDSSDAIPFFSMDDSLTFTQDITSVGNITATVPTQSTAALKRTIAAAAAGMRSATTTQSHGILSTPLVKLSVNDSRKLLFPFQIQDECCDTSTSLTAIQALESATVYAALQEQHEHQHQRQQSQPQQQHQRSAPSLPSLLEKLSSSLRLHQNHLIPKGIDFNNTQPITSDNNKATAVSNILEANREQMRRAIAGVDETNYHETLMKIIKNYLNGCRDVFENSKADDEYQRLAESITRMLDLFQTTCASFNYSKEFLYYMSELVAIYVSCELKYAKELGEHRHVITNRVSQIIGRYLKVPQHNDDAIRDNMLHMFVAIPKMFKEVEVMRRLYEDFIPRPQIVVQQELPDNVYIQYIIIFYRWLELETNPDERLSIINFAEKFMRPAKTLATNSTYAFHLPPYESRRTATNYILMNLNFYNDLRNASIYDNCLKAVAGVIDITDDNCLRKYERKFDFADIFTSVAQSEPFLLHRAVKFEDHTVTATIDLTADDDNVSPENGSTTTPEWLRNFKQTAMKFIHTQRSRALLAYYQTKISSDDVSERSADVINLLSDSSDDEMTATSKTLTAKAQASTEPDLFSLDFEWPSSNSSNPTADDDRSEESLHFDGVMTSDYDIDGDNDDDDDNGDDCGPSESSDPTQIPQSCHFPKVLRTYASLKPKRPQAAKAVEKNNARGTSDLSIVVPNAERLHSESSEYSMPRILDSFSYRQDGINLMSTPFASTATTTLSTSAPAPRSASTITSATIPSGRATECGGARSVDVPSVGVVAAAPVEGSDGVAVPAVVSAKDGKGDGGGGGGGVGDTDIPERLKLQTSNDNRGDDGDDGNDDDSPDGQKAAESDFNLPVVIYSHKLFDKSQRYGDNGAYDDENDDSNSDDSPLTVDGGDSGGGVCQQEERKVKFNSYPLGPTVQPENQLKPLEQDNISGKATIKPAISSKLKALGGTVQDPAMPVANVYRLSSLSNSSSASSSTHSEAVKQLAQKEKIDAIPALFSCYDYFKGATNNHRSRSSAMTNRRSSMLDSKANRLFVERDKRSTDTKLEKESRVMVNRSNDFCGNFTASMESMPSTAASILADDDYSQRIEARTEELYQKLLKKQKNARYNLNCSSVSNNNASYVMPSPASVAATATATATSTLRPISNSLKYRYTNESRRVNNHVHFAVNKGKSSGDSGDGGSGRVPEKTERPVAVAVAAMPPKSSKCGDGGDRKAKTHRSTTHKKIRKMSTMAEKEEPPTIGRLESDTHTSGEAMLPVRPKVTVKKIMHDTPIIETAKTIKVNEQYASSNKVRKSVDGLAKAKALTPTSTISSPKKKQNPKKQQQEQQPIGVTRVILIEASNDKRQEKIHLSPAETTTTTTTTPEEIQSLAPNTPEANAARDADEQLTLEEDFDKNNEKSLEMKNTLKSKLLAWNNRNGNNDNRAAATTITTTALISPPPQSPKQTKFSRHNDDPLRNLDLKELLKTQLTNLENMATQCIDELERQKEANLPKGPERTPGGRDSSVRISGTAKLKPKKAMALKYKIIKKDLRGKKTSTVERKTITTGNELCHAAAAAVAFGDYDSRGGDVVDDADGRHVVKDSNSADCLLFDDVTCTNSFASLLPSLPIESTESLSKGEGEGNHQQKPQQRQQKQQHIEISKEVAAAATSLTLLANTAAITVPIQMSQASSDAEDNNHNDDKAVATKVAIEDSQRLKEDQPEEEKEQKKSVKWDDIEAEILSGVTTILTSTPTPVSESASHPPPEPSKPSPSSRSTSQCPSSPIPSAVEPPPDVVASTLLLQSTARLPSIGTIVGYGEIVEVQEQNSLNLLNFEATPTVPAYLFNGESRDIPTPPATTTTPAAATAATMSFSLSENSSELASSGLHKFIDYDESGGGGAGDVEVGVGVGVGDHASPKTMATTATSDYEVSSTQENLCDSGVELPAALATTTTTAAVAATTTTATTTATAAAVTAKAVATATASVTTLQLQNNQVDTTDQLSELRANRMANSCYNSPSNSSNSCNITCGIADPSYDAMVDPVAYTTSSSSSTSTSGCIGIGISHRIQQPKSIILSAASTLLEPRRKATVMQPVTSYQPPQKKLKFTKQSQKPQCPTSMKRKRNAKNAPTKNSVKVTPLSSSSNSGSGSTTTTTTTSAESNSNSNSSSSNDSCYMNTNNNNKSNSNYYYHHANNNNKNRPTKFPSTTRTNRRGNNCGNDGPANHHHHRKSKIKSRKYLPNILQVIADIETPRSMPTVKTPIVTFPSEIDAQSATTTTKTTVNSSATAASVGGGDVSVGDVVMRTYTKHNVAQKVFVPPDIEKCLDIVGADGEAVTVVGDSVQQTDPSVSSACRSVDNQQLSDLMPVHMSNGPMLMALSSSSSSSSDGSSDSDSELDVNDGQAMVMTSHRKKSNNNNLKYKTYNYAKMKNFYEATTGDGKCK